MYENVGVWALSDSVYAAAEQVEGPSVTNVYFFYSLRCGVTGELAL